METTLSQIDIAIEEPRVTLSLREYSPGKSIRDAEQWSLIGEGYRSENEVAVAGAAFHDALLIAFAKMRVGVDFGSRTPKRGHNRVRPGSAVEPDGTKSPKQCPWTDGLYLRSQTGIFRAESVFCHWQSDPVL